MTARRLADRLDLVPMSGIREVLEALGRWKAGAAGREAIPFHVGMPDFDTPEHIKQAAYDALAAGYVRYTPSQGLPETRAAIARKLRRENDVEVDPACEVLVTCGANEAIAAAMTALVNPGDEVILPDPGFPHYEYCIRLAGGVPVSCRLSADEGFVMTAEAIARVWSPRTAMVIVNSPHNPTGAVMTRAQLESVARLVHDRGAWLMSDEAYERLLYDGEHFSPASLADLRDSILTVNCLSKTYAMTGWRLGYICGPAEAIDAMNRVHLYTVSCAVAFVQRAAIAALDGSQACVDEMRAAYRRRRDLVIALLREIPGVDVHPPAGAFYAFPSVRAWGRPSREIAMHVVARAGVGAVHGSAFGAAGEGYLRLSYSCSEAHIREGVRRLAEALDEIRPTRAS